MSLAKTASIVLCNAGSTEVKSSRRALAFIATRGILQKVGVVVLVLLHPLAHAMKHSDRFIGGVAISLQGWQCLLRLVHRFEISNFVELNCGESSFDCVEFAFLIRT